MSQPRYISPAELWVLAWPPSLRASDFEPGRIGAVVHAGTSTGSLTVAGYPRDAFAGQIVCTLGGQIGVAKFKYYTDGVSYTEAEVWGADEVPLLNTMPLGTDLGDLVSGSGTGLGVTLVAGTNPSFVLNDTWTWGTRESPQVRAAIIAGSAKSKRILGARYEGALDIPDASIKKNIAVLCRWELLEIRGATKDEASGTYRQAAQQAEHDLIEEAKKLLHGEVGHDGAEILAPSVSLGNDRFGISRAYRATRRA